jgi:hypothetical protein
MSYLKAIAAGLALALIGCSAYVLNIEVENFRDGIKIGNETWRALTVSSTLFWCIALGAFGLGFLLAMSLRD